MKERRILIVDDEVTARDLISEIMDDEGYVSLTAADGREALIAVRREEPDLALLDLRLPDISGLEVLEAIRRTHPDLPVILVSAHGSVDSAVRAVKLGAYDFLEKPLDADRLVVTVRNALQSVKLRGEVARLKKEIGERYRMVGSSSVMRGLRERISQAASSKAHVLILGETGSGKDLVARAIHNQSDRFQGPFVKLNCAAIPQELVESELFGYRKGAFTGARTDKPGRIETADGGTIFFNEIGDMNSTAQAKLLQFLESHEVERLGETKPRSIDVRVIAATNKDLSEAIEKGEFRKDLYYRLNVIDIQVPHLAMHKEDIPELIEHFIKEASRDKGTSEKQMEKKAIETLVEYSWPGNVRQLRNYIRKLVSIVPAIVITENDLPQLEGDDSSMGTDSPFQEAKQEFERSFVMKVLKEEGFNISKAARRLGFNRSYLYRKMKELGLESKGQIPSCRLMGEGTAE